MTAKILLALDDWQLDQLDDMVKKEHISRTVLIRKAVTDFLNKKNDNNEHELLRFAGSWKGEKLDGLEFQNNIRSEWD